MISEVLDKSRSLNQTIQRDPEKLFDEKNHSLKGSKVEKPIEPSKGHPPRLPAHSPTSVQSSNFISGVQRTDFAKETGGLHFPGPGSYFSFNTSSKLKLAGGLHFSNSSDRDTLNFALRNEQSPFVNPTYVKSPDPGKYQPIKGT